MMDNTEIGKWVDRVLWALLVAVCVYASDQIKQASENVAELNKKVAVILEKISSQESIVKDHELRLRMLEARNLKR